MSYNKQTMIRLYNKFNADLFDGRLPRATVRTNAGPDFCTITVTGRMTRCYGNASVRGLGAMAHYRIAIAKRLFTETGHRTEEQAVKTLVHEMAHIEMYLDITTRKCAHGAPWQKAFLRAARRFDTMYSGKYLFSLAEYADRQNVDMYGGPSRLHHVAAAMQAEAVAARAVDHGRVDVNDPRIGASKVYAGYKRAVCPCCYATYYRKKFSGRMRDATELGRRTPDGMARCGHYAPDNKTVCKVPLQIID